MDVSAWFSELAEPLAKEAVPLVGLLVLSVVVYAIARWWLVAGVRGLVRRTQATWDDALVDANVFIRLAHVAPAVVIYQGLGSIEGLPKDFVAVAQRGRFGLAAKGHDQLARGALFLVELGAIGHLSSVLAYRIMTYRIDHQPVFPLRTAIFAA